MQLMKRAIQCLLVLIACYGNKLKAQDTVLPAAVDAYVEQSAALFHHTQIYLHTDKTQYVSNENIWFSAYLLQTPFSLNDYTTLYVSLAHRQSKKVVLSSQFVMSQGMGAGYLFIPDTLETGDYQLVAYTNMITREQHPVVFRQLIQLRSRKTNAYSLSFEKPVAWPAAGDSCRLMLRVTNENSHYAKGAAARYTILADEKPIANGTALINSFGELPIAFLPVPGATRYEVETSIQKDTLIAFHRLPVSWTQPPVRIRWYAEGGNLLNEQPARLLFEARSIDGRPVAIDAALMADGQPVGKLKTGDDGIGELRFTPLSGKKYTISATGNRPLLADAFPAVEKNGYSLQVQEGVIKDTIQLRIASTANARVKVLLHNYREIEGYWLLNVTNKTLTVKIPQKEMPKGLYTLTMFDEQDRPVAERTIFAGYYQQPKLTVTTNSSVYHQRSKVKVNISVKDPGGQPLQTLFSAATVQLRRIHPGYFQDIVPFNYFQGYINAGIISAHLPAELGDAATLEKFLLTRCWTRYNLPGPDTALRNAAEGKQLGLSGVVEPLVKRATLPVELSVITDNGLFFLSTDEKGKFVVPDEMTILEPDRRMGLVVNGKRNEDYKIILHHDADSLHKSLARLSYSTPFIPGTTAIDPGSEPLGQGKTLTNVIVKSRPDIDIYHGKDGCNDYVCMYNVLNCTNHPYGGSTPVNGGSYYLNNGSVVTYVCKSDKQESQFLLKIAGRYYSKLFYVADYAKFSPPEPEILSTLYWSPQLITNEQGEAALDFYTNDLPGSFMVVIEGVSPAGVVSGKAVFNVGREK